MRITSVLEPLSKIFKPIVLFFITTSLLIIFYQLIQHIWSIDTPSNISSLTLLSFDFALFGAFAGVTLLMIIYNLVQYLSIKDKTYLIYTCYLLSALFLFSTMRKPGNIIFSDEIYFALQEKGLLLHYSLTLSLILFSLYFLQDNLIKKKKNNTTFYSLIILLFIAAGHFLFPNELNTYLWIQSFLYIYCSFIVLKNSNKKFVWAKFYYLSWLPFMVGAITHHLVLLGYIDSSFISQNAFMLGVMIQLGFITFALAERMRKNEQDKLHHLTHHAQSGLPRQLNLVNTIKQIDLSLTEKQDFCVVIIQPEHIEKIKHYVDNSYVFSLFKKFNNSLSLLLKNNNAVIPLTLDNEKLCYIHGKCLGFIVDANKLETQIETFILSIQKVISENYNIKGLNLSLSCVVGIVRYPDHGLMSNDLVKNAVLAIHQAETTPERWAFYQTHTPNKSAFLLELASDIQHALQNSLFEIYHQPQIDLKTSKVCGSECLIRWNHPTRGFISPTVFIPVAEDMGLVNQITLWVIKQSITQHIAITETYCNHMVSINISGIDLISKSFYQEVIDILNSYNITADKIIFEITESANIATNEHVVKIIEKFTDFGITVSIDDFGTGHSSFANLDKLPFQELKIDKQFVENVHKDNKRTVITETTVKMAKGLGLEVVAEGITTQKDEATLSNFGCDIGQGYYYSEALSLTEYLKWLSVQVNGRVPDDFYGEFIPKSIAKSN